MEKKNTHTSHIGLEPPHMTSFYLNSSFKDLISKYGCILRHKGLILQHIYLGGHNLVHKIIYISW